jgi:hypothetical protein
MKIEPLTCHCCSQAVRVPSLDIVVAHCKVPPMQSRILGAIMKGHGQPVQTERIIAAMDQGVDRRHDYEAFKSRCTICASA